VDLRLAEREREERTRRVPLCLAQRRRRGHCPVPVVFTSPGALRCQGNPRLSTVVRLGARAGVSARSGSDCDRPASENRRKELTERTNKFLGVEPSISPVRASCT
jgi:hypothetical protein